MIRTPAIIIALLLAAFPANIAWPRSSSVTATATATVVDDLAITSKKELNFGFISPSEHGGTVTISPENTRSATGDVRTDDHFTRAVFDVRGTPGHSYTIHTPSSLTFSQKGHDLTVHDFVTYSTTSGMTGTDGKLGRDGQDKIYLGATLIVPPDAAPGVYSGFVPLTVSY